MKRGKKIVAGMLLLLLAVSAVWALSSCSKACDHTWLDASCTAPKTCSLCGATEGEAAGHTWSKPPCTEGAVCTVCSATPTDTAHAWDAGKVTKPFDCLTTGEMTYTCTACSETLVETVVAKGHVYTETVVAPTCLRIGYTLHTCACGHSYADNEVDALDHDWLEAPTCAHDRICSRCDVTEEALAHSYSMIRSTDADCDSHSTETYHCSSCGDEYIDEISPATGHNITDVVPTERKVGDCKYVLVSTCRTCSGEVKTGYVYHHSYVASIVRDATCEAEGEKLQTCSVCGDEKTEVIPVSDAGHSFKAGTESGGKRIDTCEYCDATKEVILVNDTKTPEISADTLTDTEIKLKNANITLDSGVVNTIGKGVNVVISSDKIEGDDRDSLGLSTDEMKQLGDNPVYNFTIFDGTKNVADFGKDNYVTVTLPYTLAEGEDVDSIAVWYINDKGELASISATYNNGFVTFKTNHFSYYTVTRLTPAQRCALYGCSFATTTVEASCEAAGYTLSVCVRCHESTRTPGAAKTGHDYKQSKVDADCKKDGKIVYTCENCGNSYSKAIKSKGHDWKLKESVGVGCGNPGYKIYACRTCGEEYTEWKPQKKHEYEETTTAPTCVSFGKTVYKCKHCDNSYTIEVPATGEHTYEGDTCVHCGAKKPSGCAHVAKKLALYDFGDHGACDWSMYYYTCECGLVKKVDETIQYEGLGACDLTSVSEDVTTDENGVVHYSHENKCALCGLTETVRAKSHREDCKFFLQGEITLLLDGGELLTLTFDMYMEDEEADHVWVEREIDLSEKGACGGTLYIEECRDCGMMADFYIDEGCDFDEEDGEEEEIFDKNGNTIGWKYTETATCAACGLRAEFEEYEAEGGCIEEETYSLSLYMGRTCIYEGTYIGTYEDHDYEYTFQMKGDDCFDAWRADGKCADCGKKRVLYGTGHLTEYESYSLSELGLCGGEANGSVCAACGEWSYSYVSDWACSWRYGPDEDGTQISTCTTCGVERHHSAWQYKTEGCERVGTRTVTYYKDGTQLRCFTEKSSETRHSYEYEYEMEGTSCEDGVRITCTCTRCGYGYSNDVNWHYTVTLARYDVADYGACGGSVTFSSCPCGKEAYVDFWNDGECDLRYTSNSYEDEEGRLIWVETRSCEDCGLRYTRSYYTTPVPGKCELAYHYTVLIHVGTTLVDEFTYVDYATQHDYVITGVLDDGAHDCNDGCTLTYDCQNCDYSYENHVTWHETFPVQTVDLSAYGAVCGGFVTVERCACGTFSDLDRSGMLCEMSGYDYDDVVVEGALEGKGISSTDSEYSYISSPYAHVYTCAVTDPVRCPMKLRHILYWKANGVCAAQRHEVWQIGYNSETDTALYEFEIIGETVQYHNYVRTIINESGVSGETGVCSVCNATYSKKCYYNTAGQAVKEEYIATNPLSNGSPKRYEKIREYVLVGEYMEESSYYEKRVYADGDESWSRDTYTYDLSSCKKTGVHTNSAGFSNTSTESHWRKNHHSVCSATCTQDGAYEYRCALCDTVTYTATSSPYGHWWWNTGDGYRCTRCGLENENGADGDIILEDLTESYGGGTDYVVGYYSRNGVSFTYYASLILHTPAADGNDEVVLSGISFTERTDVRAVSFSMAAVQAAATKLGYSAGTYDVRFAFVPIGSDGSFDYAITFN